MYQLMMSGTVIGQLVQVFPISCLIAAIYIIYRCIQRKKRDKPAVASTEVFRTLFVFYLTGLVNLVLVPNNLWTYIWFYAVNRYKGCEIGPLFIGEFNFIPSVIKVFRGDLLLGSWVKEMFAGNFLMFVPMGFLLTMISRRFAGKSILIPAIVIPIAVEVIQPVIGRNFDIDDLILNFAGIIVGYLIRRLLF